MRRWLKQNEHWSLVSFGVAALILIGVASDRRVLPRQNDATALQPAVSPVPTEPPMMDGLPDVEVCHEETGAEGVAGGETPEPAGTEMPRMKQETADNTKPKPADELLFLNWFRGIFANTALRP